MFQEYYSVVIVGNPGSCRTKAEISNRQGNAIGVVYEDMDGWHTEILDSNMILESAEFNAAVDEATRMLSHYVNRRGNNPPIGLTVGAMALWLMQKDDGSAVGRRFPPLDQPR